MNKARECLHPFVGQASWIFLTGNKWLACKIHEAPITETRESTCKRLLIQFKTYVPKRTENSMLL